MGECMISRAYDDPKKYIVEGCCNMLVTLKDSAGNPVPGVQLNCNDAGTFYNYSTNSSGQVVLLTKSGYANINFGNVYSNGVIMADQITTGWVNLEAPIGKFVRGTVQYDRINNFNLNTPSVEKLISFRDTNNLFYNVAGAGGGGGGGARRFDGKWHYGGTGGSGELKYGYIDISLYAIYNIYAGPGGAGANGSYYGRYPTWYSGNAGGTSYFTTISANGGGGGGGLWEDGSTGWNGSGGTSYGGPCSGGTWQQNGQNGFVQLTF